METLVRRLGRIFSLKDQDKEQPTSPPQRFLRRMDRLEQTLSVWMEEKGWRVPVRTVSEAAQRLGTDTGTLYAYFQERVGMDFRTWRTRLRLEDASRCSRKTRCWPRPMQPVSAASPTGPTSPGSFSPIRDRRPPSGREIPGQARNDGKVEKSYYLCMIKPNRLCLRT